MQPVGIVSAAFGGGDEFFLYILRQLRSPAQYPEIFVGATAYEGVVVILLIQFEHVIVRVEVEEERDFQFARLRGVGNLGVPVGGLANIIRGITFASPVLYANQAVGTERVSGGHIDKSMLETVFVVPCIASGQVS